jgi:ZIP family zinc transporter
LQTLSCYCQVLNWSVHKLLGGHHDHHHPGAEDDEDHDQKCGHKKKSTRKSVDEQMTEDGTPKPSCCANDPVAQLKTFKHMASVLEHEQEETARQEVMQDDNEEREIENGFINSPPEDATPIVQEESKTDEGISMQGGENVLRVLDPKNGSKTDDKTEIESDQSHERRAESKKLHNMGMTTAVAIGLHNFPEGLATFVAALADPQVGAVLAVAIAIHNIPEGE